MSKRVPRYQLTAVELKEALHWATQKKHGSKLEGYVNAEVLVDRSTGITMGVTVWYTKRAPKAVKE